MGDFLEKARQMRRTGKTQKTDAFDLVFRAIAALDPVHAKAAIDTHNFEQVFGLFEMASLCGRLGALPAAEIPNLGPAMRHLIVETLEHSIRFPLVEQRGVLAPRPYGDLVTLMDKLNARGFGPVSFLTFNYDLGLDYALHRRRNHVDYCFDRDGRAGVEVMKLHGSLNWTRCQKCARIVPWHLSEYFERFQWDVLRFGSAEPIQDVTLNVGANVGILQHCDVACASAPVLVPPTWNKAAYQDIASIWECAAVHFSEAENIIISGFSLPATDEFFKFLFALGSVGEARVEQFWVFDPGAGGELEQRFRALIGPATMRQFRFRQVRLDEGIRELAEAFGLGGIERE